MYNIDLSFLKSHQIEDEPIDPEHKYNQLFKDKIAGSLCANNSLVKNCAYCLHHHGKYTPLDDRNIVEARCQGLIGFCYGEIAHDSHITLEKFDRVVFELDDYQEIAEIEETGNIVRTRRQKLGFYNEEIPRIIRKVNEDDLKKFRINQSDELKARAIFKQKVEKFKLTMKLVDIHYQFDRKRLLFFYTSDGRVDFRELAKDLAGEFKTRIELRQIGVRDEAKRIGGLGVCGREYCCSSFLYNFKRITTQIANDQNATSNFSKLSGPCGKLKCCLSFEIEQN